MSAGYAAGGRRDAGTAAPPWWTAIGTFVVCAALLAGFALVALAAVSRKSATVDESTHVVAAWNHLKQGDFRVNPEDPPLWKFTAARPNAGVALPVERESPLWTAALADADEWWRWCRAVLYGTGDTANIVLARSRAVMLGWGVALGALIGWWAWKLGGAIAAIVAVALFALDPNFLAHAPLVNGDVAMSLIMLAGVYAAWRLGRRVTLVRLILLGVFLAAALVVKFSGVFVAFVVCALVASRVLVPAAWPLLGGMLRRWWARPVVAFVVLLIATSISIAGLWACYGFRFAPTSRGETLDFAGLVNEARVQEAKLRYPGNRRLSAEPVEDPSPVIRLATIAESKRLLPQAWVYGALHTYQAKLVQPTYLLGQISRRGWRYYFPLAMAVKTPLATLAAIPLAAGVLIGAWRRARPNSEATVWTITCLALPVALYLAIAMTSKTHQGFRHVLPVYPILFIAIGVAASIAWRRSRVMGRLLIGLLAIGLATETARAFPDYIPFFNTAAGGSRGGFRLLSESNLDWGQDLPLLAKWQREHPDRKLYLSYFGTADPAHYGVKAVDVRETKLDQREERWPAEAGAVLAVSASYLQGVAGEPETRPFYRAFRDHEPIAVLGGSIYLFDLSPASLVPSPGIPGEG